jgi:hypothetical protein
LILIVLVVPACQRDNEEDTLRATFSGGSLDFESGTAIAPDAEFSGPDEIVYCRFTIYADLNDNGQMDRGEKRYSREWERKAGEKKRKRILLEGGEFDLGSGTEILRWRTEMRQTSGAVWSSSGILDEVL